MPVKFEDDNNNNNLKEKMNSGSLVTFNFDKKPADVRCRWLQNKRVLEEDIAPNNEDKYCIDFRKGSSLTLSFRISKDDDDDKRLHNTNDTTMMTELNDNAIYYILVHNNDTRLESEVAITIDLISDNPALVPGLVFGLMLPLLLFAVLFSIAIVGWVFYQKRKSTKYQEV
ncbi:hypothetical protein ABK040_001091 [Willaertia magna]